MDDAQWLAYEERREDERRQEREREEAYREELEHEDARRLARYDEAISLVRELLDEFLPCAGEDPFEEGTYGHDLQTRAEAFLADEGRVVG